MVPAVTVIVAGIDDADLRISRTKRLDDGLQVVAEKGHDDGDAGCLMAWLTSLCPDL